MDADDAAALAWYAAAAAGGSDEEDDEAVADEAAADPYLLEDPYGDVEANGEAVSDPYAEMVTDDGEAQAEDPNAAAAQKRPAAAVDLQAEQPQKTAKTEEHDGKAEANGLPEAKTEAPPAKQEEESAALDTPAKKAESTELPETDDKTAEAAADNAAGGDDEVVEEALVDLTEVQDIVPDIDQTLNEIQQLEDGSWDARCVVVRNGQAHIELQHRNPPMKDPQLLSFCDWLDEQLPLVVSNFPYIKRSGAYVDLSDNAVGPEGLDKLFRVLRDHRVPCVVMKAYRNCLTDAIVDTLIEYLYTQPESFPMHGIHISHNNISEKGAFRLIRAAAMCGHYPRYTSRLPLWLRLECNEIQNPLKLITECNTEKFNVCLMKDGMCSRPTCNHYSGVHVQLPYFLNQGSSRRAPVQRPIVIDSAPPPSYEPPKVQPKAPVAKAPPKPKKVSDAEEMLTIFRTGVPAEEAEDKELPDWMLEERPTVASAPLMKAAPKRHMTPAPKKKIQPSGPPPSSADTSSVDPTAPTPGLTTKARGAPPGVTTTDLGEEAGDPDGGSGFGVVDVTADDTNRIDGSDTGFHSHMSGRGGGRGGCGGGFKGGRGKGNGKDFRPPWPNANSMPWGGKGGKGDFKGGFERRGPMWQGQTLASKLPTRKDVKLAEGEAHLGFSWAFVGEGRAPKVLSVDFNSKVGQVAQAGDSLLRLNGLDTSMFNQRQVTDMLKQRPISLRFGDE